MKCPFCQGVIDDDSRYCDLCGKHLMFCPECRQPKKGTSCPRCGELLISAEEFFFQHIFPILQVLYHSCFSTFYLNY